MKWLKLLLSPVLMFATAFLVALHQYVNWGVWFEFQDVHHEMFIVALLFGGIAVWFWRRKLWG